MFAKMFECRPRLCYLGVGGPPGGWGDLWAPGGTYRDLEDPPSPPHSHGTNRAPLTVAAAAYQLAGRQPFAKRQMARAGGGKARAKGERLSQRERLGAQAKGNSWDNGERREKGGASRSLVRTAASVSPSIVARANMSMLCSVER